MQSGLRTFFGCSSVAGRVQDAAHRHSLPIRGAVATAFEGIGRTSDSSETERSRRPVKQLYLFRGSVRCAVRGVLTEDGGKPAQARHVLSISGADARAGVAGAGQPSAGHALARESTVQDAVNTWLTDLFHPANVDQNGGGACRRRRKALHVSTAGERRR